MSTYVYAFAASTHPLSIERSTGVGSPAAVLRVIHHDGLVAVVSDAPDGLRAKRRDLDAHHRIVGTLAAVGPVLPMRFGTIAVDDAAVERELASDSARFHELLDRVDGKVELNVRAAHDEDAVVRDVLFGDAALRRRNDALRAHGGGSYEERIAFGQSVAAAVDARSAHDAAHLIDALRPHAAATVLGPAVDGCFVNVSFLVAAAARQRFDESLARLRHDLSGVAAVRVHGPLPPYSFVADASDDGEG
jgi:hypothetical protein